MLVTVLTAFAFVSGALAIFGAYQKRRLIHYLFKPLTICFVILIALQPKNPVSAFYRYAIILGLLFSLAGDIFLMLPRDSFIQGLVSFYIAHIFYVAAFTYGGRLNLPTFSSVPFALYGILMLRLLWPHLGRMRPAVVAYMMVILLMGWTAAGRWIWTGQSGSLTAMTGAFFFIASDSLLALDKFKGRFRSAQLLILATYFTAQWLIALST